MSASTGRTAALVTEVTRQKKKTPQVSIKVCADVAQKKSMPL
ncbi:hypothetical protein [secondary endosymbiont of Ctenarytaina eucalypti]|nr:hypothetical protein [secondary endosymbiont of Ctenarytaina eucalypti]